MFDNDKNYKKYGFTLVELLVVVAIIGVLASVVLASLNTARNKGKIAAIKSNLKNMIPQAELVYTSNYSGICTGSLAGILTAIDNGGGKSGCYVHSYDYSRWGASAKLNSDPTKNYTVDQNGVSTWDTADLTSANLPGGNTKNWDEATAACTAIGGRLPTLEQLKALSLAYSSTTPTDAGFVAGVYWSNVMDPTTPANAYSVNMTGGSVFGSNKSSAYYPVRCIH